MLCPYSKVTVCCAKNGDCHQFAPRHDPRKKHLACSSWRDLVPFQRPRPWARHPPDLVARTWCRSSVRGLSYFPAQNTRSARGGDCHQFRAFKESTTYGRIRTRNWLTVPSYPTPAGRHSAGPLGASFRLGCSKRSSNSRLWRTSGSDQSGTTALRFKSDISVRKISISRGAITPILTCPRPMRRIRTSTCWPTLNDSPCWRRKTSMAICWAGEACWGNRCRSA